MSQKAKAKIVKDVTQLVLSRRTRMCNFLEYKGASCTCIQWARGRVKRGLMSCSRDPADTKVVYRRYASLFFVCGISGSDNELVVLEVIHRFVEVLDRYFGNVSACASSSLPWSIDQRGSVGLRARFVRRSLLLHCSPLTESKLLPGFSTSRRRMLQVYVVVVRELHADYIVSRSWMNLSSPVNYKSPPKNLCLEWRVSPVSSYLYSRLLTRIAGHTS